jgi:hypothetical protein
MACIKEYLFGTKRMWVGAMIFQKEKCFQKVYDEGYSPLSPTEWDDQGLPGLREGLRCWLSRVRCEHEGLSPQLRTGLSSFTTCTDDKYNHLRLYGQPLNLNLHSSNPRIMMAREHREDKEGGCFVQFGHGGGLVPSGIIAKVRTCKEGKSFGVGSHGSEIAEPD